ncbi:MAG: alpha/beta hydrolase [Gemmataceae bacterium]|nr:alpha/beta hydrolase [Gemmataceae bacterium]MDW8266386.1 alpha/beta hydrolase [Gemmataceae bacterium]
MFRSNVVSASLVAVAWFWGSGAVRGDDNKPADADVRVIRDIAYYDGPDADQVKHKLDLYLPTDRKDYPVVLFIHGGAWRTGDKNYFGVYSAIGEFFARHGVGAVVTNYRLSPAVKHPEHIKDVARAFAWTHKHIADYGGRPDQIFVCGHSAGGHLAALLATDDTYLREHGLSLKAIKGVMPMSGIYVVTTPLLASVFGKDPEICKKASPMTHVRGDAPPFLIVYAERDFPTCGTMSEAFCKALKEKKCSAETCEIKDRNHVSIILRVSTDGDPAGEALLKFIADRVAAKP